MTSRFAICLAFVLFGVGAPTSAQGVADNGSSRNPLPLPADAFADAVGVCTHFSYPGTAYIVEWAKISSALVKSGFRHIRDGGSEDPGFIERIRYLGQHGIKYATGWKLGATPKLVHDTLAEFRPYIDSVEPSNEYDEAAPRDPDWQQHLLAEQRMIYGIVHDSKDDAGVTVLGPSMAHTRLSLLPEFDAYEDAGNLHNYLCRRHPSASLLAQTLEENRAGVSSKPIWTTETGSGDDPKRNCWLPDDVIAKYEPRIVAESLRVGQPRVFFYQFADTPGDPGFGAFGLVTAAGDPKPQYTALASIVSLLSDPGPPFMVKPLQYHIDSPSADIDHLLLQKRNGDYYLLLWQEVRGFRDLSTPEAPSGGVHVTIAPVSVNISTDARPLNYYAYDSAWNLKSVGLVGSSRGQITVPVTDSISVLELR